MRKESENSERLIARKTAEDTRGEYLEYDLELQPDSRLSRKRVRPQQTERFEILRGTMKFKLGRRTIVARAGDVVVVPPGKPRKYQNGGVTHAQMRVQVTPGRCRLCTP